MIGIEEAAYTNPSLGVIMLSYQLIVQQVKFLPRKFA